MPERTITLTLSEREWERLDTYLRVRSQQSYGKALTPEAVTVGALLREIGDPHHREHDAFWARCRKGYNPKLDEG